jgi:nitric-oxide synthase
VTGTSVAPTPRTATLWPARTGRELAVRHLLAEAESFVGLYHHEQLGGHGLAERLAQVRAEILDTGTYWHTEAELAFGARVAWRNSARCIGRLYWRSLKVLDRRLVGDAEGVAAGCLEHLRVATNGGRIRPVITVFAPDQPGRPGPRIRNDQLIRYAGYRVPGGVLGDPRNVGLTAAAASLGWRPPEPRGAFDLLPLIIHSSGHDPFLMELPPEDVLEVPVTHPDEPAVAGLGLRWHAVPAISNMVLRVGGVEYPAAPFNGWYMGTEIGARNFGDRDRYDVLAAVAEIFGLDTSSERHLWRDRALVEINRAVLHSFESAGVTITDHHTESERFLNHLGREERAGRVCPADWSWIVPPMSGSLTPVFHRYYDTTHLLPNFLPSEIRNGAGLVVSGEKNPRFTPSSDPWEP